MLRVLRIRSINNLWYNTATHMHMGSSLLASNIKRVGYVHVAMIWCHFVTKLKLCVGVAILVVVVADNGIAVYSTVLDLTVYSTVLDLNLCLLSLLFLSHLLHVSPSVFLLILNWSWSLGCLYFCLLPPGTCLRGGGLGCSSTPLVSPPCVLVIIFIIVFC